MVFNYGDKATYTSVLAYVLLFVVARYFLFLLFRNKFNWDTFPRQCLFGFLFIICTVTIHQNNEFAGHKNPKQLKGNSWRKLFCHYRRPLLHYTFLNQLCQFYTLKCVYRFWGALLHMCKSSINPFVALEGAATLLNFHYVGNRLWKEVNWSTHFWQFKNKWLKPKQEWYFSFEIWGLHYPQCNPVASLDTIYKIKCSLLWSHQKHLF